MKQLASALEAAGFERGDECESERERRRYDEQPQLHASIAMLESDEEEPLFWQRLDRALDALAEATASARDAGAELEVDLDSNVRLDRDLSADMLCIDEVVLPHTTLIRLGRSGVDFRVSMYRMRGFDSASSGEGAAQEGSR